MHTVTAATFDQHEAQQRARHALRQRAHERLDESALLISHGRYDEALDAIKSARRLYLGNAHTGDIPMKISPAVLKEAEQDFASAYQGACAQALHLTAQGRYAEAAEHHRIAGQHLADLVAIERIKEPA